MQLFILDFQPFSIVEDVGFTQYSNALNSSFTLPSRKYLSNTLLPTMYEQCRTEVQEVINEEVETICITADNWTSARNDSFMAVTGHFINKYFD